MRDEKKFLKQEILNAIQGEDNQGVSDVSFLLMQHSRLQANAAGEFRRAVRQSGGTVKMVKKRVLFKAAEDMGIPLEPELLTGHIGVVTLGRDPIETTKMVIRFGKERDGVVGVVFGRFDGKYYAGADIARLATLPSKDEMRAQLLATLEAPLSQTLAVFEALLSSVPFCLKNKSEQES